MLFSGLLLMVGLVAGILNEILPENTKNDRYILLTLAYIFIFFAGAAFEHNFAIGNPNSEKALLKKTMVVLENLGQFETPEGWVAMIKEPTGKIKLFSINEQLPEKFVITEVDGKKKILPYDGSGQVNIPLAVPAQAEK